MHVVILAAGYATRMYPLTLNQPKPLLPVAGKPMVDHIIERLPEGVRGISVVTNQKFYSHFAEWAKDKPHVAVVNDGTLSNEDRLEGIGDLLFTLDTQNIDDDVLVIAGDNLFEFSLQKMRDLFVEKKTPVIAVYKLDDKMKASKKYGVLELDSSGKILGFEEKPELPKTNLAATACYLIGKEHVEKLRAFKKEVPDQKALGHFICWMIEREPVHAVVYEEPWFDIGCLKEYDRVQRLYDSEAQSEEVLASPVSEQAQ